MKEFDCGKLQGEADFQETLEEDLGEEMNLKDGTYTERVICAYMGCDHICKIHITVIGRKVTSVSKEEEEDCIYPDGAPDY